MEANGFCKCCGASIPHRIGEGRCPFCVCYQYPDGAAKINFTVSVWNRYAHLAMLIGRLARIAERDKNIALRVGVFKGNDATHEELRELCNVPQFETHIFYRCEEFGNGRGHNIAAAGVPSDEILSVIAVDIVLPLDITYRIRSNVAQGKAYYFPLMYQQCRNGSLATRGGGGALLAAYKSDLEAVGGMSPERCQWGGGKEYRAGEDILVEERLDGMGLKKNRPTEQDLYCRWHKRWLTNPFYSPLKGRKTSCPWLTVMDEHGNEIGHK